VLGCVAAAFALASCATPGYSPSHLESQLIHAGTTPQQARCVTTGLSLKFDETQLGSHSEPSADPKDDEFAKTRAILKKCGVTLALQPPS
jgi:hypothetical protein